MSVTRSSVTGELTQVFGMKFQSHPMFDVFVEIALFLGNVWDWKARAKIAAALDQLEASMALKAGQKHALSSTLTAYEEQHSFRVVTDKHGYKRAKVYLTFLSPDVFRAQLRAGYHWKDPTVSPDHGEYTHRLQWYLVVHAGILGNLRPRDVLEECGRYESNNPPRNAKGNSAPRTDLWELLFDRDTKLNPNSFLFPISESDGDFRCPNNLNAYLRGVKTKDELRLEPAQKYPNLQSFLKARHAKRSQNQETGYYKKYYNESSVSKDDGDVLYYKYLAAMSDDNVAALLETDVATVQDVLKQYPPIIDG